MSALEEIGRISTKHEGADQADNADQSGRDNGPSAEIFGHLGVVETARVPDQIDRGQVRDGRHR